MRMTRTRYETAEAFPRAQDLDIDFANETFTLEDFREGLDTELMHCREHPRASDEVELELELDRIVLEHLRADPSYHHRLLERSTG
jgi:hypothetical protein